MNPLAATTAGVCLLLAGCHTAPSAPTPPIQGLTGVRIYTSPTAPPIDGGTVWLSEGRVVKVVAAGDRAVAGSHAPVPPLAPACDGGVVVAGFQNSHVHLLGSAFADARHAPAARLEAGLTQLLTRYGFTTAFDIASDRDNTLALRARIGSGELKGPRLLTTGLPLFPPDGLPFYLRELDPAFLARMPQPATAQAAVATVRQNQGAGTDATKLFLVTPQGRGQVKRMPADVARAAVDATHQRGQLVFAHPTDLDGVRAALQAGVDILAHPPLGTPGPWPPALMDELRAKGVHLVPTLKLLRHELAKEQVPPAVGEPIVQDSVREVGKFAAAGGKVLFGTDVDYMTDADPTEEYELMAQAGMGPMQILASLTTTPAERWNEAHRRGRIAPGLDADLVVLEADPAEDVRQFARVKCAVRGGQVIYTQPARRPPQP